MINEDAVLRFAQDYGDILGVLKTLERGEELIHVPTRNATISAGIDERIDRVPTEHDEMQWRLIRLGQLAKCDVWIPKNDQPKHYQGHQFRDCVLQEFHQSLDVPRSIENIDVVWKFGPYSIKSAFEIEHSTSIYSGILRLSDLRAEAPNSNYPLFIVASEERKRRVFEELRRPTFSGPSLRLNEVIRFLGYERIRDIDEGSKNSKSFDPGVLIGASVVPSTPLLAENPSHTRAITIMRILGSSCSRAQRRGREDQPGRRHRIKLAALNSTEVT